MFTTQSGQHTITQQRNLPPWLQGPLQQATGGAQDYFQGFQSDPNTLAGLGGMTNVAQNPDQFGYGSTLANFNDLMSGAHLYGGPGFNAAMDAAQSQIQPRVQSAFNRAGRLNSGLAPAAMTEELGDVFAGLYGQERNRQMQGLQLAPQMQEFALGPSSTLYNVGQLSDQETASNLNDYISRLQGIGDVAGYSQSETSPLYENQLAEMLGLGLTGAGLAQSLFGGGDGGGLLSGVGDFFGFGDDGGGATNAVNAGDLSGSGFEGFGGGDLPSPPPGMSSLLGSGGASGLAGFAPGLAGALGGGVGPGATAALNAGALGGAGSFGGFAGPGFASQLGGGVGAAGASGAGAAGTTGMAAGGGTTGGLGGLGISGLGAGILGGAAAPFALQAMIGSDKPEGLSDAEAAIRNAAATGKPLTIDGRQVELDINRPAGQGFGGGFYVKGSNDIVMPSTAGPRLQRGQPGAPTTHMQNAQAQRQALLSTQDPDQVAEAPAAWEPVTQAPEFNHPILADNFARLVQQGFSPERARQLAQDPRIFERISSGEIQPGQQVAGRLPMFHGE